MNWCILNNSKFFERSVNSWIETDFMEIGWFEQNGFFFPFFSILIFMKTQSSTNLCISFHSSLIVFDIFTLCFYKYLWLFAPKQLLLWTFFFFFYIFITKLFTVDVLSFIVYYKFCDTRMFIAVPRIIPYSYRMFKLLMKHKISYFALIIPPANIVWGVYRNRPVCPSVLTNFHIFCPISTKLCGI